MDTAVVVPDATAHDLSDVWSPARVGAAIRAARKRRGLSASELARRSAVSQSFLSQVEAGQSDISVGRLIRVAQALQVELTDLLERPATVGGRVVRVAERVAIPTPTPGLSIHLLSPSADHTRTYAFGTLERGATAEPAFRLHGSESFLYMVDGAAAIDFTNGDSSELTAGDTISYLSDSFVRMRNLSSGPSTFVWVQSALERTDD